MKTMFTLAVFEILLFEGRSVLDPHSVFQEAKGLKELQNHILFIIHVCSINTDKFAFFNLFVFPFFHLFNKSAFSTYSFGELVFYLSVFLVFSACSELWIQWDLYRFYNICLIIIYMDARSLWFWAHCMKATCKNIKIVLQIFHCNS